MNMTCIIVALIPRENYEGTSIEGDVKLAGNGDLMVRAGSQARDPKTGAPIPDRNFHFYYRGWPPYAMNASDVGGVYITNSMWLEPDNPTKPYNLSNARYVGMGVMWVCWYGWIS
jgi:hypothetical protein